MTTTTKPTLPPGFYPQIYRGAIRGDKLKAIATALDGFKDQGLPGVFFHMFPTEDQLVDRFRELAALAHERGLLALAAFGLDATRQTPLAKGTFVGTVAALPECHGVALDAESWWDNAKHAEAKTMCDEIRRLAPNALVLDQPWPQPKQHSRFPWQEFADAVDLRAPQYYYNDWKKYLGATRYAVLRERFDKEWEHLETRVTKKPRIVTLQGYGWDDIWYDLVTCLLANPTAIIWCDPFPSATMVRGFVVVKTLRDHGFTGPDAVKLFQAAHSLTVDGLCGPNTLAALGV